jgi:hypothetical protein
MFSPVDNSTEENIMVNIAPITPAPATKVDAAPKTSPRANPGQVATDRVQADAEPVAERRRNPDRRRRSRDERVMDRRLGADRRKRTVDISV